MYSKISFIFVKLFSLSGCYKKVILFRARGMFIFALFGRFLGSYFALVGYSRVVKGGCVVASSPKRIVKMTLDRCVDTAPVKRVRMYFRKETGIRYADRNDRDA